MVILDGGCPHVRYRVYSRKGKSEAHAKYTSKAQKNPCLVRPVAIVPFSLSAKRSESPLTHMALPHVIGSFSTSEDRHIGYATLCILIQFLGVN